MTPTHAEAALAEYEAAIAAWGSDHSHPAAVRLALSERAVEAALRAMRPPPANCAECGARIAPFTFEGATTWMHRSRQGGMLILAHAPLPAPVEAASQEPK